MTSSDEDNETVKSNSNTQQRNNVDVCDDANDCDLPYCFI